MSYPSQKRRLRRRPRYRGPGRGAHGGRCGSRIPALRPGRPDAPGAAGWIQTMGGITRDYQQGGYGPEGVLATESQFSNPRGLGFAPNGDLYITDALNHRVRKIDANGVVSLVAGTPSPVNRHRREGLHRRRHVGHGPSAQLNEPHGVAVDSAGNVYIADSQNCVIRKVDTGGIITKFAGTGQKAAGQPDGLRQDQRDLRPADPLTVALDQPKSLFMTPGVSAASTRPVDRRHGQQHDPQDRRRRCGRREITRVAGTNQARHYGWRPAGNAGLRELRHPEGLWVANDGDDLRHRRRQQPRPQDRHRRRPAPSARSARSPATPPPPRPTDQRRRPHRQQRR